MLNFINITDRFWIYSILKVFHPIIMNNANQAIKSTAIKHPHSSPQLSNYRHSHWLTPTSTKPYCWQVPSPQHSLYTSKLSTLELTPPYISLCAADLENAYSIYPLLIFSWDLPLKWLGNDNSMGSSCIDIIDGWILLTKLLTYPV